MDRTKQAQAVRPGDYLRWKGDWLYVVSARPLITTVEIAFGDGTKVEFNQEALCTYKTGEEIDELNREEIVRATNEARAEERSSQNHTGAGKKGLRPLLWEWLIGIVGGFVLSGSIIHWSDELGAPPWLQLAIGIVSWVGLGWLIADGLRGLRYRDQLSAEMEEELRERNSEVRILSQHSMQKGLDDFVTGFNQAGVEIALGGLEPFGRMAEAKLRMPATQLHKHLVDIAMEGYFKGVYTKMELPSEAAANVRESFEEIAWKWIREMTEGKR